MAQCSHISIDSDGAAGSPSDSIDFDCGIAYRRIAAWLDDELDTTRDNDTWIYQDQSSTCRVELTVLQPRTFGNLSLERTRLVAEGGPQAIESLRERFTLRFMSAGG